MGSPIGPRFCWIGFSVACCPSSIATNSAAMPQWAFSWPSGHPPSSHNAEEGTGTIFQPRALQWGTYLRARSLWQAMATTAAAFLVKGLIDWGVDTVFGIPGDGINGIVEALRQHQKEMRFIQVRHEESAAFMACGYAKITGRLGVCLATSGPGGIHLLNGLYDAKLDGQPVLAITGHHFHDLIDTHAQQDVDLDKLFMDVCGYNARVMGAAHVENALNLACRATLSGRGPSHLTMPVDLQSLVVESDTRSERNV